jgi:hypothetical protein
MNPVKQYEWDSFLQGMNLEPGQPATWSLMGGLSPNMLDLSGSLKPPEGGGGNGRQQQTAPGPPPNATGYFETEGLDMAGFTR